MYKVDLNSDLGESFGRYTLGMDEKIIPLISSANIACGFHASDPVVMMESVSRTKAAGIRIGAHPGFPDLMGFGRRNMAVSPAEAKAYTLYQISALGGMCQAQGMNICEAIKEYDVESLRSRIGVVLQKAVLFKGTIEENLRWGNENATKEELEEALKISQAKEFVDAKPGRMGFRIEQGGRNLSGGQKQRLTIARALVRRPDILILDDSASALDFATDAALRSAIRGMGDELTVFIVSQRAASIQYADLILVLEDGKIAGTGTHAELLDTCPAYQEIYYSQFPKEVASNG